MSTGNSMENKTEMGLQKIDMPNFDGSYNVKEKRCTPAIDILSNIEKEMCRNGTSFQDDCDEFLKIMSNNTEKMNAPNLTNGPSFTGTNEMNNLEKVFLNQVNDMDRPPIPTIVPVTVSHSEVSEVSRKQCIQMERRIDRLTRRLKLKQSKVYGLHTSEQISGLIDFCRCQIVHLQNNPHSEMTMDVYLKRLKRCSEQSCVPQHTEKCVNYFGSSAKGSKNGRNSILSVVPKFDIDLHEHIEKISGELHAQIKAIANDFDSDVTASSSGNESLDEETPLPASTTDIMVDRTKKIAINKRAIWRWLRNRASIAYRLSWLQSRMSALEYKIHHYTEIYKKLRCSKGQVVLQKDWSDQLSTTSTALVSGSSTPVPKTAAVQVVLNGYHGSLATVAMSPVKNNTDGMVSCSESDDGCSRTCPIVRTKFRIRNLIRLDGGLASGNAAISSSHSKFSSMRCDCVPPVTCVLCSIRGPSVDLSYQHIYSNLLSVQSKIALLEPAFHPVLSCPSDASVSTHFSALLNNDDVLNVCDKTVENVTNPPMTGKRYYSNYKTTEEIRRANSEVVEFKRRKKYIKRQGNNSQNLTFGRSQLSKQRHSKLDKELLRKRRRKRLLSKHCRAKDNRLDNSLDEGLYYKKGKEDVNTSQPGSPHSSHSSTVKDPIRRKRGQSYDIDNFIIPPNSTPTAPVSKPQYKEILIPRWKVIKENSLKIDNVTRESLPTFILDDLSDDNITKLHEMMEQNERKKFRTNATRQGRSRKRTDSCPETSETNTPERISSPPWSITSESNDAAISPNVSAALSSVVASNQVTSAMASNNNKNKISHLNKKNNADCDNSSVTDTTSTDMAPFELRLFPLSDNEYRELLASHLNTKLDDNQSDAEPEPDPEPELESEFKPETTDSRTLSPFSESTDSVSEDPDDPDWMMKNDEIGRRVAEGDEK